MSVQADLEKPEVCSCCGRFTERGKEQISLKHRANPISKIDLTKPLSELIAGLRHDIAEVRGKLDDIGAGFTGWRDRLVSVQGLLTCGLVALHHTMEEMREHERKYPKTPAVNQL